MKKKEIKISFLGDIMCELPLLRAYQHYGKMVFSKLFEDTAGLLSESDFVIGNLETVCAGKGAGFTKALYSFNTPDDFLDALAESYVNLVLLANNHCFDRGEAGLERTIKELSKRGIQYTGASLKGSHSTHVCLNIENTKIAIYSLTESTNFFENRVLASATEKVQVNMLRDNNRNVYNGKIYPLVKANQKKHLISEEHRIRLKKLCGKPYNQARCDDFIDENALQPYLNEISDEISKCKDEADIVIVCPHMGGQFNIDIGKFSTYMMEWFSNQNVDAVIASHPHIVQKAILKNGIPLFYSLGNFSMSPSSEYLLFEGLPQYGIIVHLYIAENQIFKSSFSVVKIVEQNGHQMRIIPVDEIKNLTEKDKQNIQSIVNRIKNTNNTSIEILREYALN